MKSGDIKMIVQLLNTVCQEWADRLEPLEIRKDFDKIVLLRGAMDLVKSLGQSESVSDDVRGFYQVVFLRDVWSENERASPYFEEE